eukprot:9495666-Lingulodinium_polyedra.AAC.1
MMTILNTNDNIDHDDYSGNADDHEVGDCDVSDDDDDDHDADGVGDHDDDNDDDNGAGGDSYDND